MKFTYTFKTSDGVRHEDVIECASRDTAFETLREKGIRPIKVVSADGSKANGETRFITRKRFVIAALVAGLLAGAAVVFYLSRADFRDARLIDFETRATEIVRKNAEMVSTLHLEVLRNYQEISSSKGTWMIDREIELSQFSFKEVRGTLKDLFREAYAVFPSGTKERGEVESVYQRMMDVVDLGEARIANDVKAFRLLKANREKWEVVNGQIEWKDPALAADFAAYTREFK